MSTQSGTNVDCESEDEEEDEVRQGNFVREYPKQKREKWLLCNKYCILFCITVGAEHQSIS